MNPFTELLTIIDDWTSTPGQTIRAKRGDSDVWPNIDRAVRLLLEISDFLHDRQEAFPNGQQLTAVLWEFVIHPDVQWNNTGHSQKPVEDGWRAMMEAMAAVWENESAPIVVLDSTQLQSLRSTLEEVRVLVGEMLELSSEERDYLTNLIGECQRLLDVECVDFPVARGACMEVVGAATVAVATHQGTEQSQTLFQKILRIGGYWFAAFSSSAVAEIASSTAMRMLTDH